MRRLVQGLSRSAGKAAAVGLGLALGCSTLAGLVGGPAGAEPAAGTVATVAVGSYPSAVVVAPTGNRAFVANSRQPTTYSTTSASNGSVSVINTTTNPPSVTATVTVKRDPEALAVRPGGTQLYVVNAGSNSVSILKLTTATPTVTATVTVGATKPEAITFTPTGNYAYVTSGSGNDLDVINCATKAVVHKTLGHIPHGLAFAPGGSPLYVTAPNGGRSPQVLVVNPANPAAPVVTSTLSVGGTPHAIGFVPGTTHTAYMTNIDPQTVTVLDASATPPTVSGSVHFDAQPWTVAFTPGGQRAYVNLPGDNQLVVLDTSTDPPTVLGRDGGLTHPSGMAVTPDGQWVYAANRSSSGTVSVFPEVTPPVVTSVTTQDGPTAGGNTVTITGQRLTGATAVTFGSAPGTGIAVNATGTTLTVTAPAGSGTVPVTVKIGAAQSTPVDYTYAPSITTTTLPAAEVGVAYTTTLSAAGGTGGYTWSVTPGSLPTGLSLDPASGTISGTPTAAGTSTATVTVADSSTPPQTASATLAVDVQPPVAVTTTSLPPAAVGQGYRATLAADGGQGPFDWSVAAGTLPTGLALDASTGVISGVPAQGAGGEQTVTVKVTDALGGTATAPLVVDTFGITPGTPPSGEVGAPYLTTFTATEGTAPYWWAVTSGSLPAGLTLDPATGVLSGTPTTAGVATFTVSATDSATPAVTVSEPVSLVIDAAGPPTASSVAPAFGPAAGGTKVTIHGTALGHVTAVTFGSVPARSFTVVSDTTVTAVAPGGSGTVNVTVTNPDGTSPAGTATQFTYTTWSGRTVSNPAGPSVQLYGISCPATGDCVAVGATTVSATTGSSTPTAFVQHDGTWLAATLPSTGRGSLNGVSCTAVTRCMAVGQVLGSDSLYHQLVELLRTGAWTAITLPDVGGDTSWYSLNGVACPSPTRCVAVGGYVTRYGWFQPLTEILTTSGGNWSAVPTTPALPSNVTRGITATLYGVSCPSTTTCVAVGQVDNFTWTTYGTVPSPLIEDLGGTTTDPTWTPVDTPQSDNGVGLNSVSCPAVGDCVAVGSDYGTMGALRLADGAWSTTPVPHTGRATGGDLFGVTCPNTDECLASGQATGGGVTGGAVETFAGGYWQGVLVATQGRAIDCTSATDCVTAGFGGATRNSSYGRVAESLPAVPVPVVTGLSPATGSIDGGTTVTISGGGFTGATGVLFGAVPATGFSVTWDGRIVATAPAGSTGAVDVTVTGPGGTSATSPADTFTYGRPATVTGLDTTTGPTTGGTSVVVHGTNFSQALAVDFGSNPATFTVDSDTELTATAPPGPAGTVDVTVSTPPGPSATSPADRFTYVAVPTSFSITVNGSGTSGTSTYGTAATFAEVGLPASATGTVTFTSGTKTLCVATMPASTSCHPPATLGAGTYPGITASFVNTDGSYGNSTSTNTVSLTVTTARLGASYAYVGGPGIGNGDLATISTTTHHAGPTFTLGAAPTMLAITPDGQTLYANAGTTTAPGTPSHEIVPIATATGAVGPAMTFPYFPNDIAITPDGQTGWVANGYDPAGDDLTSFSVATGAIGRTIQLGTTAECWAVAITPQGTTAYVARDPAAGGHGNVVPVDLATGTVGTPITVDGSPTAIAITPDGKKAYVTNSTGPVTQITLTATWTKDTTKPISVGTTTTTGLAITPDGATVYVTSWHNKLIPITVATGTAGSSISVSGSPWKVAITPAGTTAYVGPLNSTRVTLVTLRTKSTTRVTVTPYGYAVAVTPDQAPVAALSVIPDVVGRATSFDASASTVDFGTITSYAWTFGDGQTATTTTPTTTHTYMAAETYTASVTETDSAGTSTTVVHTGHSVLRNGGPQARTTRTVTVTPAPTSFSIDVDGSGHATVHLGTVATLSESGLPSQATGTVAFTSGTTVLCTATLPATSCTTTPTLPVASYPAITAHFGGDHNYESSTATGTVALTVIPPLPVVTGVTPPAGYITGGTSVTIMGRHLSGATGVDFGTSPAQSFSDDSGTEITAVSPAGSPGPVDITVTTGGGTSAVSADDHFTYLAIPTTTTLGSDQNPSTAGQEVTFTATVATDPAGLAVPTGTVSFVDTATGTTLCSTVALSTATRQQEASCAHTFTTTSAGDEIVASYVNSDGNFVGSASDPVDQAVTHATAAKVVVTTQPPTTVTAGTPFGLTATVEDAYGNVVTTSSATVTVAITSGPDGATLLGTTTVTATAGVATFGGLTLDKAATGYTLKVTSGSLTPTVTTTVTVTPAAATHFVLQAPGTATAGTAVTVTITATDAYGNTATGYVGTVHFTSTDPQAVLPGDVTFTAGDHGVVTEPVTFKTAGTQTVTATDTTTGSITGTSGTVAVTHAGATKVVVTAQPPATVTAGIPFGLTATVEDAYGNTVTTSSATVTVALTTNPGSATLLGTTTVTATEGVATFGNLTLDKAGTGYTLAVTSGSLASDTTRTFTVTHATAAKVVVTTQPPATVTAGTPFGITAKIEDAFGNVVTTSSATVTVAITSGPDGATLLGTTTVTATAGVATFSGLTLDKAGTGYTLKVTSGSLTPAVTTTVTVTPAAATHFVLQTVSTATAGTAVNVTVTATDAYGNTATGYIGTVHFTSTDPQAALPGDVTFTAGDHGAVTEP
ncbi:MAG TPA: IPT/TIG domain-containing protein, partial [Acidimicrobiales bacterium]|nr:IPT/TIG domain-containing protein [Acidimicrobiales bacterium]